FDPLGDLDLAAASLTGAGTDRAELVLIVRGRLDEARLRDALAARDGGAAAVEYHGGRLVEGEHEAFALLTARTAAFGSRGEVRRVIDVALGNDEGLRRAAADRSLLEVLGRAP